jgi:DNA gyrase/topoisomerase IV subunit A
MKLRSLTNLDSEELTEEKETLEKRLAELTNLIQEDKARTRYMVKEIKEIGVRYGEKRRSELIDPPEGLAVEKGVRKTETVSRPKFMKIDMKRGVAEQVKGPRGAIILEKTDKLITLTNDGTIKKVPPAYKGPLGMGLSPVLLAKKESEVAERKYLVVFTLEDTLKAMMVAGSDLCKVTSKGKNLLPENAELKYFGEGSYVVPWTSTRKKKVELFPVSTKQGRPGAKGIKVAALTEIQL